MLNIMGQFKASPLGPLSVEELHKKIEAMKMAYADVKEFDGDPRFGKIPVGGLLSNAVAVKRAGNLIQLRRTVGSRRRLRRRAIRLI